jgi:hypothetical protein
LAKEHKVVYDISGGKDIREIAWLSILSYDVVDGIKNHIK